MSPNVYRLIGPMHNRLVVVHPAAKKGMGHNYEIGIGRDL